MSQRAKLVLSLFGVALSVVGFYVSNASAFPWIRRIIAPSYVNAKAALDSIRRDGAISAGALGFVALAEIVESRIAEQNRQVARSGIVLERLEAVGGGIAFGQSTSRQVVGLKMFLRGQKEALQWDLLELATAVEAMWEGRSLSWAMWLFWIGVAQTIWPLFVQTADKKTAS
jgi:hypothetical protein